MRNVVLPKRKLVLRLDHIVHCINDFFFLQYDGIKELVDIYHDKDKKGQLSDDDGRTWTEVTVSFDRDNPLKGFIEEKYCFFYLCLPSAHSLVCGSLIEKSSLLR